MTPQEFIEEARRRGLDKDETKARYEQLLADGAFDMPTMEPQDPLDIAESQLDAMDGPSVEAAPERGRTSAFETFKGALDTVATIGSEGAAGLAGMILGTPEGIVNTFVEGTYGTPQAGETLQRTIQERGDILRREPTTEIGKENLEAIGDSMAYLFDPSRLGPLAAAVPAGPAVVAPFAAAATAARLSGIGSSAAEKAIRLMPGRGEDAPDTGVGAAETDSVAQMMVTAREFGFEGDAAPTLGQVTRDRDQQLFENEVAKTPEGAPIDQRRSAQQQRLAQVFDEFEEDNTGGRRYADDDDQGRAIQGELESIKETRRKERARLYKEAREAGEMDEMIEVPGIVELFDDLRKLEDLVPASPIVMRMAVKQGLIDEQGRPQKVSVQEVENFREFVNKAYKYDEPRERMERGKVVGVLDNALDLTTSGEKYAKARAYASRFRDEFYNSPLASAMTRNKKNQNVPSVDPGKTFDKVLRGSVQEIDQLKATLSRSPEGQQQWGGIQGRLIEHLRNKAFGTQQDSDRNSLATPSTFIREIQKLSRSGKLSAILGDKQAGQLEDLAQLVSDLFTSVPGSAQHSNNMAAIKQWMRMAPDLAKAIPVLNGVIDGVQTANTKRRVRKSLSTDSLLQVD